MVMATNNTRAVHCCYVLLSITNTNLFIEGEKEMSEVTYTISKHAKERYASRILNKETNNEIQTYIAMNDEKIHTDIVKMITYGSLIYTGKQTTKDNKTHAVQVFVNGCWIVLVDANINNVITLYKIDLGCGDDFNLDYINRMLKKIDDAKITMGEVQLDYTLEANKYREIISSNTDQINEYKTFIKNLEAANEAYKELIENNTVKIAQANKNVAELVNTLIGKKEF